MKTLATVITSLFLITPVMAQEKKPATPPAKAAPAKSAPAKKEMPKVEVKKPCKAGQTAEKDGCHEVKKLDKKK